MWERFVKESVIVCIERYFVGEIQYKSVYTHLYKRTQTHYICTHINILYLYTDTYHICAHTRTHTHAHTRTHTHIYYICTHKHTQSSTFVNLMQKSQLTSDKSRPGPNVIKLFCP